MSILIHGLSLPPKGKIKMFVLFDDGVLLDNNDGQNFWQAVELPPHGRLIDADALDDMEIEYCDTHDSEILVQRVAGRNRIRKIVADAPTLIPADPADKEGS